MSKFNVLLLNQLKIWERKFFQSSLFRRLLTTILLLVVVSCSKEPGALFRPSIDKDLGDPNIDVETRVTNAAYNVYEITLSTALASSSKEYIAATIIHEMLHVYLPANDGETDHEIMAEKYVKPMAFTLKAAGYALTYDDAIDLSWGGLQKTKAWKQLVDIDRVSGTNVTDKILQTNVNYKNNTGYGARCN
ncbi:hypothetical protein G8759_08065 [Spirosoma aureum]|uniref:SprT family zinc-dependent metalloprotease n=1 Tax=Spirosoma aureum TaxID=2692134 RepID=A0A6G9AJT6_9BACT|nr:hypothetical protein [Spirosoma aureum]QIP12579.1 hypothetical protein G8759_08065 [Spirosoma aureum]